MSSCISTCLARSLSLNWWTVLTLDMASIPAPGPLEIEGSEGSEGRVNTGLDPPAGSGGGSRFN